MVEGALPAMPVLGIQVHALNIPRTLEVMAQWINEHNAHYICFVNANNAMLGHDQPGLREVYNCAGLAAPDGMPMVWLLRWTGYRDVERVYGPDLLLAACAAGVERGWRHYFYGGAPGVAEKVVERLRAQFPSIQVAGWESPPFCPLMAEEEAEMVARIRAARPDILWVGLGSPKQDIWMYEHLGTLGVPVLAGVGAAFDFLAVVKRQAPRWMQRSGLEWLHRLLSEPRRLWRRYVLGYPRFVVLLGLQKLGLYRPRGG